MFIDLTEKLFGYPIYGYWKWHNTEDAVKECNENPVSAFHLYYPTDPELWKTDFGPVGKAQAFVSGGRKTPLPSYISEEEFKMHQRILAHGGYRGPLNWYKAMMRSVNTADEDEIPLEQRFCELPALLVVSKKDYVTRADMQIKKSTEWCKNLKVENFDCGHWIQLERKDEFNQLLEHFAREIL